MEGKLVAIAGKLGFLLGCIGTPRDIARVLDVGIPRDWARRMRVGVDLDNGPGFASSPGARMRVGVDLDNGPGFAASPGTAGVSRVVRGAACRRSGVMIW